ncbi:MAG: glycerate kinase, partial [Nitrospirota bacterium]
MKILIAMNSFKGSISAVDATDACFMAMKQVLPDAIIRLCPVSDGGDGLIDVLLRAFGGKVHFKKVTGPLFKPVLARYLMLGKTAVLEMSEAAGIKYLDPSELDCMNATSFGVGEVIKDAVLHGAGRILVGLGGSASNDAGIGCARGFGFRLLDKSGQEISGGIKGL